MSADVDLVSVLQAFGQRPREGLGAACFSERHKDEQPRTTVHVAQSGHHADEFIGAP
jgi:hypothetical protein